MASTPLAFVALLGGCTPSPSTDGGAEPDNGCFADCADDTGADGGSGSDTGPDSGPDGDADADADTDTDADTDANLEERYVFIEDADGIHVSGSEEYVAGHSVLLTDLDADSISESVIASPTWSNESSDWYLNEGRVFLLHGPLDESPELWDGVTLRGGRSRMDFGTAVVSVTASDGTPMLLVGAPGYDRCQSRAAPTDSGGVFVVRDPLSVETDTEAGCGVGWSGFPLQAGAVENDRLGEAVAASTGPDGIVMMLAGAPGTDGDDANAGAVFVASAETTVNGEMVDVAVTTFSGGGSDAEFGTVLASGDLDSDGTDDVTIAAPADSGGIGAVFVYFGPSSGIIDQADSDLHLVGSGAMAYLGSSLDSGDLDGDGGTDLGLAYVAPDGLGRVCVLSRVASTAELADAAVVVRGEADGDDGDLDGRGAELRVRFLGDADEDGKQDLAIGFNGADLGGSINGGAVYLRYGPVEGDSDLATAPFLAVYGDGTYDAGGPGDPESWQPGGVGTSISRATDASGDGHADVLLGIPSGFEAANNAYLLTSVLAR